MMNLEFLMQAAKTTGNKKYEEIARTHANTTLKNHFRKDNRLRVHLMNLLGLGDRLGGYMAIP
ncbi:Uncharacterised protein [Mycobacterium tuberculosis]|nr:Uncharacterised protein [Mycobacterium tuberculosis]